MPACFGSLPAAWQGDGQAAMERMLMLLGNGGITRHCQQEVKAQLLSSYFCSPNLLLDKLINIYLVVFNDFILVIYSE